MAGEADTVAVVDAATVATVTGTGITVVDAATVATGIVTATTVGIATGTTVVDAATVATATGITVAAMVIGAVVSAAIAVEIGTRFPSDFFHPAGASQRRDIACWQGEIIGDGDSSDSAGIPAMRPPLGRHPLTGQLV